MQQIMQRAMQILANVEASLRIEGLEVTVQTHKDCEDMLAGLVSADELIAKYVAQYVEKK